MVVDCKHNIQILPPTQFGRRRAAPPQSMIHHQHHQHHVVVFPYPAQGHMRPFEYFVKKLVAEYHIVVTFVTTTLHLERARRCLLEEEPAEEQEQEDQEQKQELPGDHQKRFKATHNKIQLVCLDLPAEYREVTAANFVALGETLYNRRDAFAELIKGLMAASSSSSSSKSNGIIIDDPSAAAAAAPPSPAHHFGPPLCIISDMFLGWTQDIAHEFKLPRYCLSSAPTHFISLLFTLPELNAQGRIPARIDGKPYTIAGMPPIAPLEMPRTLQGEKKDAEFLIYHSECLWRAAGVLVNSVYELESSIVKGLQDKLQLHYNNNNCKRGNQVPRILTVGPLAEDISNQASSREKPQAVEDEDNKCLQWLNKQSTESILYICFGTVTAQTEQQMREIALGLEASGVHFLWIVRVLTNGENRTNVDVAKLLPQGFIERMKDKGLVYSSWAPQLRILAHPAVKGFLTHCGWNSIMESIAMGVPMIAWPNHAEQMMNCRLCVDILNIAIPVQKKTGKFEEVIGQDEVKRVAQLFMENAETAHFLKKNVEELSKSMAGVHAHGGSSKVYLDLFVNELNSMTLIKS